MGLDMVGTISGRVTRKAMSEELRGNDYVKRAVGKGFMEVVDF